MEDYIKDYFAEKLYQMKEYLSFKHTLIQNTQRPQRMIMELFKQIICYNCITLWNNATGNTTMN